MLAAIGIVSTAGCLGDSTDDGPTESDGTEVTGPATTGTRTETATGSGETTGPAATTTEPAETTTEPTGTSEDDLVYRTGTPPSLPLGDEITATNWVVEDVAGESVASGEVPDAERLSVPVEAPGYYELSLREDGGTETNRVSFGILPRRPAPRDRYFGQATHYGFGWDVDSMSLLRVAGASLARDSLRWQGGRDGGVEAERGSISFTDGMDAVVTGFDEVGVESILLLNYNHTGYIDDAVEQSVEKWPNTILPYTETQREAFAEYAVAVLDQYPDVSLVEVWNEPNSENFSRGPSGADPNAYRELLKRTYAAIKDAHPRVTVISGGTSGTAVEWHDAVMDEGGVDHMDGVAFHPYNEDGALPEFQDWKASGTINDLNATIRQHNGGDLMPVWITELGWTTTTGRSTEIQQARRVVRSNVYGRTHENLESYCYYGFRNDTADDTRFGSFGLLRQSEEALSNPGRYAPKPSYVAYAVMTRQLGGAEHVSTGSRDGTGVESVEFAQDGETVRVLWAEEHREVPLAASADVEVVSLYGARETRSPDDGKLWVTVGPDPTYVRGPTSRIH
jgi:hypothetical protein